MIFLPSARYAVVCSGLLLALLVSLPVMADILPGSQTDSSTLSVRIQNNWAVRTKSHETQKQQMIVEPELETDVNTDSKIVGIVRLRADAKDKLSPGEHNQTELRELYLDTIINDSIVVLGKQQIVWGKSDGLKVLDVVNPQNFREFILDDFEQSRIPLWSANVVIPVNDITFQILFIPDQTYHKFAKQGSRYQFSSSQIVVATPAATNVTINSTLTPNRILRDADVGFRLSTFSNGWDLTFNYLYHYDDTPVLFRTMNTLTNSLEVTPQYKRTHLIGGTFSNTFGDLTLRGEIGILTSKYISTNNILDADGVVKTAELKYVLGFDWYGFRDTLLSTQIFQTYLSHYQSGMIREQLNTQITFLMKQEYMNETWHVEMMLLHDLDYKDGMLRPKLSYEYSDEINIYIGADIFYGNKNGLFGQFRDEDRVVSGIVIGF